MCCSICYTCIYYGNNRRRAVETKVKCCSFTCQFSRDQLFYILMYFSTHFNSPSFLCCSSKQGFHNVIVSFFRLFILYTYGCECVRVCFFFFLLYEGYGRVMLPTRSDKLSFFYLYKRKRSKFQVFHTHLEVLLNE